MRVLLDANAKLWLMANDQGVGQPLSPLGAAVIMGDLDVIRELIQHSRIKDGIGESHGVQALNLAARRQSWRQTAGS